MPDDKEAALKKSVDEPPVELESQYILRIPPTPAASLRAAVRSGVMNLKDRLTIQLEPDMRHGIVKFDKWYLSAKVADLPTLVEMHKTLDRKTFYKTADICQMMICKEEDDSSKTDEEESPKKKEKKDSKDKKFLYPHGLTPPLKNVRKRRFRKTLKKKYVDFPEIEKEVKRLFRMDNEAINVRYEIVNADDEKNDSRLMNGEGMAGSSVSPGPGAHLMNSNSQSLDVAELNLFGDVVSTSEEDVNIVDSGDEDNSRPYPERSYASRQEEFITEFSKEMLESPEAQPSDHSQDFNMALDNSEETAAAEQSLNQLVKHEMKTEDNSGLMNRLSDLEQEIAHLQAQKRSQEVDIAAIENQALKQRFQNSIDSLRSEIADKQCQLDELLMLLHQS